MKKISLAFAASIVATFVAAAVVNTVHANPYPRMRVGQLNVDEMGITTDGGSTFYSTVKMTGTVTVTGTENHTGALKAPNFCPLDGGAQCFTGAGLPLVVTCASVAFGATDGGTVDTFSCDAGLGVLANLASYSCSPGVTAAAEDGKSIYACYVNDANILKVQRACLSPNRNDCSAVAAFDGHFTVVKP